MLQKHAWQYRKLQWYGWEKIMGLEAEKCLVNSYSSKSIHYFNKHVSKWCLVPMYYISTLNIFIFPSSLKAWIAWDQTQMWKSRSYLCTQTRFSNNDHEWSLIYQQVCPTAEVCKIYVEAKFEVLPILQSKMYIQFRLCMATHYGWWSTIYIFLMVLNDWTLFMSISIELKLIYISLTWNETC
jgi:hypothetical protein